MKDSKMKNKGIALLLGVGLILLSGCASYSAQSLALLPPDHVQNASANVEGVKIACRAFTKADCEKFLDRDVIKKGYQPVQLYVQNDSDSVYLFSLSRLSLPCAPPEEVADKVHTSTVGRAVGYGAAALVATPIFAIPAIVDGIKSSKANASLDRDYSTKVAKDQMVYPHSHMNSLLFVPASSFQNTVTVTLIDQKTNNPVDFTVPIN